MSTVITTQEYPIKKRFEVRQCNDIKNMNYVVWDRRDEVPVAYHLLWVPAQISVEYYELHPPLDIT